MGLKRSHILRGGDIVFSKEVELLPAPLEPQDFLAELGRHPGRILPLLNLAQDIQVVNVQRQEACVFRVLFIRPVGNAMCRRWPLARLDSRQISLNRRPDAVLREQRILSAWDHEPLLAPQPEAETVPVADLPAHVLHEHKEVSRVVGVLDGGPQVCLQHGAEGGLALALPQTQPA